MVGSQVASPSRSVVEIQIVGSSTFGRYPKISGRRTYNMFISDDWLVDYSGWKRVLELQRTVNASVEGRGIFHSIRGQLVVAVVNSSVWSLSADIGASFIGNLLSHSGPVFMDENLSGQICIVDGTYAYIYNRFSNSLTQQSLNPALTPNYVCYHNTYFLFGNGDTTGNGAKWYAYAFDTDTTIQQVFELALQTKPDYAKAIVRLPGKGNNVLVLGTAVGEIQNNVNTIQGYQRVSTINIDYGVLSIATIASSDTFVCWLAVNEKSAPVIMYFDGMNLKTISTDGINYQLGALNNPAKSVAFFYKKDGHLFYQITFYDPEDNLTLVYDFNTQKFFHLSDADLSFHPARQVITYGNKNYFVSLKNGSIYQTGTDFTTYDENLARPGNTRYKDYLNYIVPRQIIGDTFRLPGKPETFRGIRLNHLIEQGEDTNFTELGAIQGLTNLIITQNGEIMEAEDGEDLIPEHNIRQLGYTPHTAFSFSRDGAQTFTNEVRRIWNFTGHRQNVVNWTRLGRMNEFTPKMKFWTTGRVVAGNATLEIIK